METLISAMLRFIGAIDLMAASGIIRVIGLVVAAVFVTAVIAILVFGPIVAMLCIIIVILGVKDEVFGRSGTKRKEELRQEWKRAIVAGDIHNIQSPPFLDPLPNTVEQTQTAINSSEPFPFFKLPRELRDDIYARFTCVKRTKLFDMGLNYFPKGATYVGTISNMTLVSKQFKQEYEEQVARRPDSHTRTILVMSDCLQADLDVGEDFDFARITRLHKEFRGVTRLHLVLEPEWQWPVDTLTHARDELKSLLGYLPLLKAVHVEFPDFIHRVDLSSLRGDMEVACAFLLRDDNGHMIGNFDLEYSATLYGQRYTTTAKLLAQTLPGFAAFVPQDEQRYVAEWFSGFHVANYMKCRATISDKSDAVHGLNMEFLDTTWIADFEEVHAQAMAKVENFLDEERFGPEFFCMWRELNKQWINKATQEIDVQYLVHPMGFMWVRWL